MMPSACGMVGAAAAIPDYRGGVDVLMDLITNLVATKTWQDNGGTGTISSLSATAFASARLYQVQCEIKAFLADLRAQRRAVPNVVVELQWLWLDGGQYAQLQGSTKHSDDGITHMTVDAKALERLGRTAPGFRGRIACANGQLVHLASGDRRSIIVNTVAALGGGHSPVVQTPNAGVVVQLRPSVVPGEKAAIVDLQSAVTRWRQAEGDGPGRRRIGSGPTGEHARAATGHDRSRTVGRAGPSRRHDLRADGAGWHGPGERRPDATLPDCHHEHRKIARRLALRPCRVGGQIPLRNLRVTFRPFAVTTTAGGPFQGPCCREPVRSSR